MTAGRRRPYRSLRRADILEAALELVDRDGLDALTMRRLADVLGAGTMSLYRHVRDRDDLLDGIGECLALAVEVPSPAPEGWREGVHELLASLRAVAHAHPTAFPLLALRPLSSPAAQARTRDALGLLAGAGHDPEQTAVAARALVSLVNGFVLAELQGTTTFDGEPDAEQSFRAGIDLVLDGFEAARP